MKIKQIFLALAKIFAAIGILGAIGLGAWYYWFIYSYERWFDTHLVATVWSAAKKKELAEILNQPFRCCGQGSASIAYESADGQFVLKIFRQTEFVSKTRQFIPLIRELANRRKELRAKYNRIFGPINAYQYIPFETGMIYYQFIRPQQRFDLPIQLIESDGSITWIDPNQSEYLIQKKAIIVVEYLLQQLQEGNTEKFKTGTTKLLQMARTLYDQGIVLVGLQFLNNFGFVDDEPIRIDVEHIRFDPTWKIKGETHFKKQTAEFREWVEEYTPELLTFFDRMIKELDRA